ncbi:hypothetical protein FEMY_21650 [Ferrovum myxofaciens]|uniref:Uncharacterized protein n=1 Tax=Ferrovum myxofaciens TaxID=416213 RepID=A0A149VVS5_9PROT|nr:hypothetical protein FEMY_21650 [Ferrovum myxofaciens]
MHPPHIPFQTETQTTKIGGTGNHGPGSGLFGKRLGIRIITINRIIQVTQESDCIQILPSTIAVRNPLTFLAAIIQIKH